MNHRQSGVALLVAALFSVMGVPGSWAGPATVATGGPIIGDVPAYDAPAGGKGGIQNTLVRCRNFMLDPRAVMQIRQVGTDWRRTYRWTGAYPALHFPRVATGTYKVTTTASCAGVTRTKKETVTIAAKTTEGTISRAEFGAVELGMSLAEVTAVVGFEGRDPFTDSGATSYTYDNMSFWDWSIITFRNDRVIRTHWKVGHD